MHCFIGDHYGFPGSTATTVATDIVVARVFGLMPATKAEVGCHTGVGRIRSRWVVVLGPCLYGT